MLAPNKRWLIALLLIAGLVMVACAPAATEEATEQPTEEATEAPTATEEVVLPDPNCSLDLTGEEIVIYQQVDLTGPLSTIAGGGLANGSEDGVQAVNDAGGVCGAMLRIERIDTQYDPPQEVAAYETHSAMTPPPVFILTYSSSASLALAPMVAEDHVVNIGAGLFGSAVYSPEADGWTVLVAPTYADQTAGFIQFLHDNWADIKPADAGDEIVLGIIGWDNAFGTAAITPEVTAYAESQGVTLLPLETFPVGAEVDVQGNIASMVGQGANAIYIQSLAFGPAQVLGTIRGMQAAGAIPADLVVGGVNWSMNQDVINLLGDNAGPVLNGYYAVFPYLYWNDDVPGVAAAQAAFDAGGYPATDHGVGYLLSFASIDGLAQILRHAIETDGFENLNGDTFRAAMEDLGTISEMGLFTLDVREGRRAPGQAQIRQAQVQADGSIEFVVIEDFHDLPDMRPQ